MSHQTGLWFTESSIYSLVLCRLLKTHSTVPIEHREWYARIQSISPWYIVWNLALEQEITCFLRILLDAMLFFSLKGYCKCIFLHWIILSAETLISDLRRDGLPGHKINMLTKAGGYKRIRISGVFPCSWATSATTIQPPLSAPPSSATNGAIPSPSMHRHLCQLPPGCENTAIEKRWTNEEGKSFGYSPDWLSAASYDADEPNKVCFQFCFTGFCSL